MEMEARQHLLAQVVVVTQRTPTPAYNTVAVSRDHASLQQGGQLASPHWLTMPRPVHASSPAYNVEDNLLVRTGLQTPWPVYLFGPAADSPVRDFSFT